MKFTSIKQIPKEGIEMIDDVQWWNNGIYGAGKLSERLDGYDLLNICNRIKPNGDIPIARNAVGYYYIEPRELEDKTFGINLYKKIHGEE